MPTTYRFIIMLVITALLIAGCNASEPQISVLVAHTPVPATITALPSTATSVPLTNTPILPTATVQPTDIPTLEIPNILWDKTYGKTPGDMGEGVLLADDGGFYIVGTTDLDMDGAGIDGDVYLIRTDPNGETLWEKTYGSDRAEQGLSITWTKDGNLMLAGTTKATEADGADVYLIKVDPDGNEIWSKIIGSALDEMAAVEALSDGSFMVWGNIVDPNDIIADPGAAGYGGFAGRSNLYLAHIDAEGKQLWTRTFGGNNNLIANSGVEAPDGGFVVLASLLRFPELGDDLYLLKVDQSGNMVWERTWEDGTTNGYDLIRTDEENYLIAATYTPADSTSELMIDFLFIKVDQNGNEIWTSSFGDPDMIDYPMVVTQIADGGYVAIGDWVKDFSGRYPGSISVVKLDPDGKLVWEKIIKPQSGHNILRAMVQLLDGNCLIVGSKLANQQFDIFMMKVDIGASSNAYLGETPPGLIPQVFSPGIISIPTAMDYGITFSSDGTELYFTRRMDGTKNQNIYEMHFIKGTWSVPVPVAFSADYNAHEPHLTADNETIYFGWFRPPPQGETSTMDAGIWATDRIADGWSAPRYVGEGMFVSSDMNGQFYVTHFAGNSVKLSKVILTDGRFTTWEDISNGVHPAIAPDGSYLVFDDGNGNLRVKFHLEDDQWSAAQKLSTQGIPTSGCIASISPDGKYLFYVDNGDLYWVSTEVIQI